MDPWKFYDITHRGHVVCNPTSEEKLTRLVDLVQLPTTARVVDIACGKGEFLIRLVEAYGVRGVGVDLSPFFIADAERRLRSRVPQAGITFTHMDGADFKPDKPHSLTVASCIGASWVFGGHARTLDALVGMAEPDGWVIVGQPYGLREPSDEHLRACGLTRDAFGSHAEYVEAGDQPTGASFCWRSPQDSLVLWARCRLSYPLRRSTMQAWSFRDDREVRNSMTCSAMPPAGRIGRGSKHRRPWSLASVDESRNRGDQISSCADSGTGTTGGVLRHDPIPTREQAL